MQSLYAYEQSENQNLNAEEKFLKKKYGGYVRPLPSYVELND